MRLGLEVPAVSSSSEEQADWLELNAITASRQSSSYHDLVRALQRSGTADATCESVRDEEGYISSVADDAFAELDDRVHACGGQRGTYPFSLSEQIIELRCAPEESVYVFLLLLSAFGKDVGPQGLHGERVFEDICSQAAASYFGAPDPHVGATVFGFPRRVLPANFPEAVEELCKRIGEGGGNKSQPRSKDQKDAKLDVVIWRNFPDGRRAKLIGFGQCATGVYWSNKCSELQPGDWCSYWMMDAPLVTPMKFFFVPHRIDQARWDHTGTFGGIVFDRCRIALHSAQLDAKLNKRCTQWSRHVIKDKLLGGASSRPATRTKQSAKRTKSSSRK